MNKASGCRGLYCILKSFFATWRLQSANTLWQSFAIICLHSDVSRYGPETLLTPLPLPPGGGTVLTLRVSLSFIICLEKVSW